MNKSTNKTEVCFDTYPIPAALGPKGGYAMKIKVQPILEDTTVFEEVVREKTLPLSADLLEFAFRAILTTMARKVSRDCRPRRIGNLLKAAPYLRGNLAGPYSAYDEATCSCAIVFSSLSGLEKRVDTREAVRFVNARIGTKVKIDRITYEGSTGAVGVIGRGKGIVVTGLNCQWLDGDACTLAWTDGAGERQSAGITPTGSSVTEMRFAWPAALAEVADGTEIEIAFLTRGGIEDADPQPNARKVRLVNG